MQLGIRRYVSWGRERRDRRHERTNRVRCNCLVDLCPGLLEVSRTFLQLFCTFKIISGTSVVVQWLRFCLPVQAVQVQFLVGELGTSWPKTQNINNRSNTVTHSIKTFKMAHLGLPSQLSGKESACQCRRHRFDPRSGKIPCALEQLSPCAIISEPVLQAREMRQLKPTHLKPVLCNKRNHGSEKPQHHNWRVAPALHHQRKAREATKTQHSQKLSQ